ncbi:hypothetical protein GPECTOR_6g470 [Gonium pectorale]|uniref:Pherophorin domain-containing protein n=1 Tax=Gonium pectorale TaxID=33097 RepID=A0A150GUT5_GONPE|nr:hypothetical protein GPECTOR_6g470 [Gonium pectorale]|eukprot:KXZ53554.1 hypothetical protein GPECTOR_6g470 [Gonium pectorale]
MTVTRTACLKSAYCCNIDLSKVEIPINSVCRADLRSISVNGVETSYSWGVYDSFTTLKFTGLRSKLPNPDGASLCWVALRGGCGDPRRFCYNGQCQVEYFSSNNKCCPTYVLPVPSFR